MLLNSERGIGPRPPKILADYVAFWGRRRYPATLTIR
jgi:hypothetical protein